MARAAMNVLPTEKKLAAIFALVEGNNIRSIERMTGIRRDTIMRLTVRVGERCQEIMAEEMKNLRCQRLQVDEIWTYVLKHRRCLSYEERHAPGMGDQYVFVGIDAESKLIPHFEVGKRNMVTAYKFMETLKRRLADAFKFQLTTDAFVPYIGAVERAWSMDAPDFGQLVKSVGALPAGPGRYAAGAVGCDPNRSPREPGPGAHFDELCGATEPHDPHGVPALHAADQCVQQERWRTSRRRWHYTSRGITSSGFTGRCA